MKKTWRLPALFHAKAAGRCDLDALAGKDGGDMVLEAVSVAHSAVHVGSEARILERLCSAAAQSGAFREDFASSHHLRPDPPQQPAPGRGAAGTLRPATPQPHTQRRRGQPPVPPQPAPEPVARLRRAPTKI